MLNNNFTVGALANPCNSFRLLGIFTNVNQAKNGPLFVSLFFKSTLEKENEKPIAEYWYASYTTDDRNSSCTCYSMICYLFLLVGCSKGSTINHLGGGRGPDFREQSFFLTSHVDRQCPLPLIKNFFSSFPCRTIFLSPRKIHPPPVSDK